MTEIIKKNHLKNLVAIAMADGRLDNLEKEFLLEKAYHLGFGQKEMEEIMLDPENNKIVVNISLEEREEIIADAILLTVIDGDIDDKELAFLRELAKNFQFSQEYINKLLQKGYKLWNRKE